MITIRRAVTRTMAGAALLVSVPACSDKFLAVTNPDVIDAATVDPTSGATSLANSAQQNFVAAYGYMATYSAWFTGEANVSDTFPTRNEFGFRQIADVNGSLNGDVWQPISLAVASAKLVLDLTLPSPTSNINYARAAAFRGFSILSMATDFCAGTLSGGPKLTTAQLLDTASYWFNKAISIGNANASADGIKLANASAVGLARARLQAGDKAGAQAAAALVPAGFVFNVTYTDDLANRQRLSNRIYQFTYDRGSISVAPSYRTTDPRVPFLAPGQSSLQPQDVVPGGFYPQNKFPGYASPMRLASRLEADYIAAEASGNTAQQLTLINARRAANGQPAYAGATDATSVMAELYVQRAFEFFLEDRKLADFRRNQAATPFVTPAGATYFKPGYANTGTQTCYPVPYAEYSTNKNYGTP